MKDYSKYCVCTRTCTSTHFTVHNFPTLCSGLVPLHNACSYGHYEVAELLVQHMSNVNVVDLWKFTPLHEAAAKGKYEICKLLLKVSYIRTESDRLCAYINMYVHVCQLCSFYNPVSSSSFFSLCPTFPLSPTPFLHSLILPPLSPSPSLTSLFPLVTTFLLPLPLSLAWSRH